MTEVEWLAGTDPTPMLVFLRGRASERKLRLFACAGGRRHSHLLVTGTLEALEVAERFADGLASPAERKRARSEALNAGWRPDTSTAYRRGPAKACVSTALAQRSHDAAVGADGLARHIGLLGKTDWDPSAVEMTEWGIPRAVDFSSGRREQAVLQAATLRCLFGNLFRSVSADPRWLTSTAVALARSIYEERAFDRLPILADALEDAGCDGPDLPGLGAARPRVLGGGPGARQGVGAPGPAVGGFRLHLDFARSAGSNTLSPRWRTRR